MGSALAYPLGDALITYVYANSGTVRQKLALCEYIQSLATAQILSRPPNLSALRVRSNLDQIGRDLDQLWGYYEPVLDTSPYQFRKRAVFQITLRRIMIELLSIIDRSKMLDARYMAEGRFKSALIGGDAR